MDESKLSFYAQNQISALTDHKHLSNDLEDKANAGLKSTEHHVHPLWLATLSDIFENFIC